MTKQIRAGRLAIGGGAPVSVQSMCNTKTEDVEATVNQVKALAAAGCELVRLAVPTEKAARALRAIREQSPVPLSADIHFDYRLAILAAEAGMDKLRINPGNIGPEENVRKVADACRAAGIPIRIGVNGGSLEKGLLAKYGGPTPEAMLESALGHVRLLNKFGFDDICLSLKCSEVPATVAAYELAAEKTDYPLHVGITEAGGGEMAVVKAAAGIGALLLRGVGDTLRVSMTGDPLREPEVGIEILRALGLRRDAPDFIACPTCGRTEIDLEGLYNDVRARLQSCRAPIRVAVMGCVVNGPGEAAAADYGVAGGKDCGLLFRRGQKLRTVPYEGLADALADLIRADGIEI
ncbi:MAG: flavodoxin-dependent (E)-4-hydroxy-3-methylbut-2-enyl-diphosphate synthase [Oscillospiraceae bacterium]|nr:flavodoxin-dependent (E)-4-hydroxy-3-methylbut-2-enyl-diphosphate synthase [Oscillospiraceae bacterium]